MKRKNSFMKKIIASFLAVVMVLIGIYWVEPEASEAQASATQSVTSLSEDGSFVALGYVDYTWSDADKAAHTAPTPKANGYTDWLFSGWYEDAECTIAIKDINDVNGSSYAKFVQGDMLDVKIQVTKGIVTKSGVVDEYGNKIYEGKYVMRFISSLNSLDYKKVGFTLTGSNISGTATNVVKKVFKRIESTTGSTSEGADTYEFSPKIVGTKSEWLMTAKWPVAKEYVEEDYTVTAFWETWDGTKVTGKSRCASVNDGQGTCINVPVDGELKKNVTYTASFSGNTNLAVTRLDSGNARIDLPSGITNTSELPSATEITLTDSVGTTFTAIYRNYYTSHNPATGTTPVADTTWYEVNKNAKEFVIASSADLYGLAKLVNGNTDLFADKTIILVRDVVLNDKTLVSNQTPTEAATSGTGLYAWTPIGDGYDFKGIFDGDENTISGVYINSTTAVKGLFGSVASTIKNIQITNSYITSTQYRIGGITGVLKGGNIENAYVDSSVYISSTNKDVCADVGGIVGFITGNAASSISKSWFSGKATAMHDYIGGIVGRIDKGTNIISDCLFTGTVIRTSDGGNRSHIGGMVGTTNGKTICNLKDCVSIGSVQAMNHMRAGSVFGSAAYGADASVEYELVFEDVYTTHNLTYNGTVFTPDKSTSIDGTGSDTTSVSGIGVKGIPTIVTSDQLKGENGYVNTDLDFYSENNTDGIWVATDKGPELKAFTEAEYQTTFTASRLNIDWYTAQYTNATLGTMALPSGVTFELDSEGDMYGFAAVLNGTTGKTVAGTALVKDPFAGDTVQLKTDVALNEGWKPEVDENGTIQNGDKAHAWPEMPLWFQGIFDGEGHVVSGAYQVATTSGRGGLFGAIQLGGTVKNLKLIDSYFKCTLTESGSIAGLLQGTLQNVYSNAYVVTSCQQSGGLIGRMQSASCKMIDNCWYDGQMYITEFNRSSLGYFGGIVGNLQVATGEGVGKNVLRNCLFTGSVTKKVANTAGSKGAYFGGIAGGCHYDHARPIEMTNCLSVGASLDGVKDVNTSALVGLVSNANTTITGCYATRECRFRPFGDIYDGTINGNKFNATTYANGYYGMMVNKAEILGDSAKTNMPLLDTNTAWKCVEGKTPILSYFADWWLARQ